VGACIALRRDDYMVGNHRSHGHPIGKGAKLDGLMAELLAKKTGVCGGKGGSMHLADFSVGSLGETSIVGSGIPVAAGAALGAKMKGLDRVSLCFFGDGASNEGTFHEGINMAANWKLPVIFLCENNGYAVSTPIGTTAQVENIADRAIGYGIPGVVVDGQFEDPWEVKLDRANARDHLACSAGNHRCLGAPLARVELRHVLGEVLRRIPDYRIERERSKRFETIGFTNG
jgi:pyruvate dehydrogenase E1 component alpha subunit